MDALILLETLAAFGKPMSFSELQDRTGMPPATLNRRLAKLIQCEYVNKEGHGEYAVGHGLVALATLVNEHSAALPFRPLLDELADRTGKNAELHSITRQGPVFQLAVDGQSEFTVGMKPGHLIRGLCHHPSGIFFFHRFPEGYRMKAEALAAQGVREATLRRTVARAVEEGYFIRRGASRPEITRAGIPIREYRFCLCVSGLTGEFPRGEDEKLRRQMQRIIRNHEKGTPGRHSRRS